MLAIIWNDEPGGNVEHIAEHGLTKVDVEAVLAEPEHKTFSRSSGLPFWLGKNLSGTVTGVVFEWVDDETINPVTAYVMEED